MKTIHLITGAVAGLAMSAALLAACAEQPAADTAAAQPELTRQPASITAQAPEPALTECGEASYYANSLAGAATASGEPYSPSALTAAHKTLPLGTRLIVKAAGSGRRVVVTVNDRGPFIEGRIVDLSRAAAEQIGMIDVGVIDVCLGEASED